MSQAQIIPFRARADAPLGAMHTFVRASSDDVEVVHVFGDLDLSVSDEFELTVLTLAAQRHVPAVIVDLTGCNYLDSSILNATVRIFRRLNDRFAVVVPYGNPTRRIFSVVRLDRVLPMYESIADAAADLGCIAPLV